MQMIDEVIKEIAETRSVNVSEISECERLMRRIEEESQQLQMEIPRERWLAICAHLLAFVRRMESGEKLPAIEAELFAEIHPDMVSLSRRILFDPETGRQEDETETFLLAVHFEAIRTMQA